MSVSENNMTDDEDFMELALLLAFPRKRKMFLERPNHFTKWRDNSFLIVFAFPKILFTSYLITLKNV